MADKIGSSIKRAAKLPGSNPPRAFRINKLWLLVGCILAAMAGWAYWPAISDIFAAWLSNPDYTHGFFVIPISLWLLWLRRNEAPEAELKFDWRGLGLIVLAGAIRFFAGRFYVLQLDAWSIPIWIAGIVWLLFGWQMLRWALPAIAFLWFATPLPGTIEIVLSTPLQRLAASLSASVLRLIGQPALVEGTTILLDEHPLDVERACSGLRMFYGVFAMAVALVALARPARWKAVLVMFAAAPVAIIANVVRIVVTALLIKYFSNEVAQKFSHDMAGILMIPLAVVLFLFFLLLLGRVVTRMSEAGGVAWIIKWCVTGVVAIACILLWGRYQQARALSTLLETAKRYESEKDWPKTIQYLSRYIRAVPNDLDTYTHLARIYQSRAESYQDQLRAVDLMRTAWKNQRENEDLATGAVQLALQLRDYDTAIQLADELIAKASKPETRSEAMKLRAEALYRYIQSDKNRGDYTWAHVKDAFENELKLPDYDVTHADMLADVYRNPATPIKNEQREKLASALMERIVKERANDPVAWLAHYRYRSTWEKSTDPAKLESDLSRAIDLAKKNEPKNPASWSVLSNAAMYKFQRGDASEAIACLERAIEIAPTEPGPYILLADIKAMPRTKEANDAAIGILKQATEKIGKPNFFVNMRYASLQASKGNLQEAESAIAPFESSLPRIAGREKSIKKLQVGLVRGQILFSKDGPQAAATYLGNLMDEPDIRVLEQLMPNEVATGYGYLGNAYSVLGLTDLALDAYRQAARIQPANVTWQLQTATLTQQTGDLESADREYRTFIQKGQGSPEARARLVELEIKRQLQLKPESRNFDLANSLGKAAAREGVSPVTLRLLHAQILAADGKPAEAEQSLVKFSEELPKEPNVWRALAVLRSQRGDHAGALKAVEKFAGTVEQPLEPAALRAGIFVSARRFDDAVKELQGAIEKSSPNEMPRAALALSQLYSQIGKPDDARQVLEKAHEKDPRNLQIVDTLANNAWLVQDWQALEKYESWLNKIEGKDGTLWRAYRTQRLLGTAQSVDDDKFKEAVAQTDFVIRKRPRWSKSHYLQGDISYRMNRFDAAAAAYERAWQLGGRGVLLADRMIDVLTRQGRSEDARKFVDQARDYLVVSQGLFDRAIPYLTKGDESQDMVKMAQQWVDRRPNDPEARLRLGRVLLMLSQSLPGEPNQKLVEQAQSEFRRAIELAPNDVRPWAASVMLYGESPATRKQALQLLDEFAKKSTISELERSFVLGQLYDSLGIRSQAQFYFQQAASKVEADPKAAGGSRVLGRTAKFYFPREPALGELYARHALEQEPNNPDAMLVLLLVYASRNDSQSAQEGLRLLDEAKSKNLLVATAEQRYRAAFLARRGRPEDLTAAIELMRRSNTPSRADKLLLAHTYEQAGQLPQALDLLQQLVRAPNASSDEMVEFLRFWQKHFLAKATGKAPAQFAGQAKEVYERLGELDGQLPERLRWQLRESKVRKPAVQAETDSCTPIVLEILASPAAKNLDASQLVQALFIVLLQEQRDECASQLATSPPTGLSPVGLAISLSRAYIAVPATKESQSKRDETLDKLITTHEKNADVIQSVGDCAFMSADYDRAADAYQRVLKLKPDHPMTRNNLALSLVEAGKTAEARQILEEALKANADNPDLRDTQASLEIIDNHPDKAIPILEKLVGEIPENAVIRFHLAIAYHETKNTTRARETLFAASALGIQQQILSPRDKKSLDELKSHYMAPGSTAVADRQSASAPQARN